MAKKGFQTNVLTVTSQVDNFMKVENLCKNNIEHATITFLWQNRVKNISRDECQVMDFKKKWTAQMIRV